MFKLILNSECAAVTGSRMKKKQNAIKGGMPIYKFIGNIFLTKIFNFFNNANFTDCHTGYWVYDLKKIQKNWLKNFDNGFLFDLDMRKKILKNDFNIEEIPIISRSQDYQRGIETEIQLEAWLDFVYQEVGYDYDYKKEKDYKVLIKDVDKGIDMMHERNNFWAVPSKVVKPDEDDLPF